MYHYHLEDAYNDKYGPQTISVVVYCLQLFLFQFSQIIPFIWNLELTIFI